MNTNVLKGKRALVSGATGGIGSSIAHALAAAGCDLFLTSTNETELKKLRNALLEYDVSVSYQSGCLTDKARVYDIIGSAKQNFGQIDVLINSAGIYPNGGLFDVDDDLFDDTLDINFRSAFIFTREFAKEMVSNQWGRIVNIGSSSCYSGVAKTSMYCASKHALLGFTRSIHDELKQHNVRAYCVSPSSTQSKMGMATENQDYSTFLNPDDVAKYVVFVISFDSNIMSEEVFLKRMIVR
jgi:NAD(P)-dependent dehydrogenase (short-subunit alcohol dehydrogenase family)